jgi:hypothetical protein
MVIAFIAGAVFLVIWIVLAFVIAVPAGWVHLFLAAASVMIARGIVLSPPKQADSQTGGKADRGASQQGQSK